MNTGAAPHNHIAIIGTGFGAIATAVRLQQAGFDDFVLIDRAGDVGGVWRDNSYPGAAVDVKSHLYSLSFAPNPDWHDVFAKQPELHAYLRRVAGQFDLRRRLVLGCEVEELRWDGIAQRWTLETQRGPRTAQHVVVATGALAEPVIPDLPGLTSFKGARFHSARWDHSFDLSGKRVAVIGTGASAIQFVPAIQPIVDQMTVFQRTPPWIMPRHDHAIPARTRKLFRALPLLQRLERARIYLQFEWMILGFRHPKLMRLAERRAQKHLEAQVPNPELREKLTPDYTLGCKRILLSDDYLPALAQPNVEVNTGGIREIRAHHADTRGRTHATLGGPRADSRADPDRRGPPGITIDDRTGDSMTTALITGASSGIGQALALELAARGYDLGLAARRLDALEQLRQEIRQRHPDRRIELRRLDVTDYDHVPTAIDELATALGGLDVVIANAGVGGSGPIGEGHAQADRAVIETNLLGAMATIDAAVALFQQQGRGQIVAISSVAAFRGLPGSASYSASKAAIATYTDALRAELYNTPIKVTTLYPGYIDTPLNEHMVRRPFLISLDKGAALIADKIERGVKTSTIPTYPWNVVSRILRILPTSQLAKMAGNNP
jgi:cation diffusion facilitator CzcD-associated flavoprotein CzcO/short-subunit dehydrogenase